MLDDAGRGPPELGDYFRTEQHKCCEEHMRKHRRNLALLPTLLYVASFLLPEGDPYSERLGPHGRGGILRRRNGVGGFGY
jgi:hypothetical protein